jgi:hypothetical protein
MKVNVLDAQHFIAESWRCVSHETIVNCFQKCGYNLNQSSDNEDAAELSIAKDDWDELKTGVSFQEYVTCDNDAISHEVQTLGQMINEKFTSDVSEEEVEREEEDDADKIEIPYELWCLE